jgi:SAM-dependent methyltransferase
VVGIAQTFWLRNLEQAEQFNHWVFSEIAPHLGDRVLEVGCGIGNFTALLAEHCRRVVGLDISEEYVSLARNRFSDHDQVEVLQKDIMEGTCEGSFDTVVMLDVLEHIDDDVGALRHIAQSLVPGGDLVVKVPALQALYGSMDEAIGHYRRYDRESLSRTLRDGGFEVSSLWFFNRLAMAGWWVNGKLLRRKVPSAGEVSVFNKMLCLTRPVETLLRIPVGLSLFAVGKKR